MAQPRRKPDPVDAELERWRGAVEAEIKNLVKSVDGLTDELKDERDVASKHRSALREVIQANSAAVAALTESMRELKPVVTDLVAERNQAKGFVWALRCLYVAGGGLFGAALVKFGFK